MPYESLQAVVGTAVIDTSFRKALLNGSRLRVIQSFDLTHEESDAVMAIRAESLEQFAHQLDKWIENALGKREPPTLELSVNRRPVHDQATILRRPVAPALALT